MCVILYFPLINNRSHKNHSVLITRLISLLLFIYVFISMNMVYFEMLSLLPCNTRVQYCAVVDYVDISRVDTQLIFLDL